MPQHDYFLSVDRYPQVKLKKFLFFVFIIGTIRPIYEQVLDLNAVLILICGSLVFVEHHLELFMQLHLIKELSEIKYKNEFD